MLAFTDEALARVLIAGTRVDPDEQSAWLESLADQFEKAQAPTLGAHYTRRWRNRRDAGRAVLHDVPIEDETALQVKLAELDLLDPRRADQPRALAAAAGRLLDVISRDISLIDDGDRDNLRLELILKTLERK